MTRQAPAFPERRSRHGLPSAVPGGTGVGQNTDMFLSGPRGAFLVAAGLAFVGGAAFLDHQTGSRFSFSLFYLIPVAACAWWGGFSCGILLSLAGAAAWHAVDARRDPTIPGTVAVWNGVVRFGTLTLVSSVVSRLHVGIRRERLLARTDPLTGAANARTFYAAAAEAAVRACRTGQPLTVAYFDLDDFKRLNDRQGHAAGDAALRHLVQTARAHLRSEDLVARLGGDEFAVLLCGTGGDGAAAALSRLQGVLSREMPRRGWPVTLSVGAVTFLRPPRDVDLMIQRADALMYGAKRKGKGRVEHEVAEDTPEAGDEGHCMARRATAVVLGCTARVRPEGQAAGDEEIATVRGLSAEAIRLHLDRRFAGGTLLLVDPLSPGPRTLLARVVHAAHAEGGWEHGCELAARLSEEELHGWLGGHLQGSRR